MRRNHLWEIWKRDEAVLNGWIWVPSAFSAEIMAHQDFDSLTLDLQHGMIDFQVAVSLLQAISTTSTIPFVRVPWNEPASVMKILDAGAYGIIAPMVNNAAEARQLSQSCRFPPDGFRSLGPSRANLYAGADYVAGVNDELVVLPMIETAEGLDNLEAILDIPGISGVYVGPGDLALALGREGRIDHIDPFMVSTQERIARTCRDRGMIAGIHTGTAAYATQMAALGFNFLTIGSDARFLAAQAKVELSAMRLALSGA